MLSLGREVIDMEIQLNPLLFSPLSILLVIIIGFILIAIAQAFTPQQQQVPLEPVGDLLPRLDAMPLSEFTELMVSLMEKLGLRVEHVDTLGYDADGIAITAFHPHEVVGGIYVVYCMRNADQAIGVGMVHRLRNFAKTKGAMKAIFITTGTFSRDALNVATALPGVPVEFVDGERLEDWLAEYLPQEISDLPPPPKRGELYRFPED